MMESRIIPVFLFLSVFSLFSCLDEFEADNTPEPEIGYAGVDERLWDYYQIFEEEGRSRGINVDLRLTEISAEIDAIHENNVIGTCEYGRFFNNHITIDDEFWARSSVLGKEFVVFHELGHCFLNRDHKEDSTSEGLCVSLMRSGTGNCRDAYNSRNRDIYLDELFSENN